jgi:3-phosphoshikimate 1-carboxyvinyltransferase
VKVEPAAALVGDVAVPGVKSIAHRALLLGAVADGESTIAGFGRSDDTESTIHALRQLGVSIDEESDDRIRVEGVGLRGLRPPGAAIDCGNAGTLIRLLAGILAGQEGEFTLTGDPSLSARPMERIAEPLRAMGAEVHTTDGHAPITIVGRALRPISYRLPVASAQVKSCVLLAGLYADHGPTVVVEKGTPTRDHTERMLRAMGTRVESSPREARVWPVERLDPLDVDMAGDFSAAAPFLVAAALLSGSELRVHGVNLNPTRTGLLDVLERMGARISVFNRRSVGGEPAGDVEVRPAELVATEVNGGEVPLLIDELPLVALAATHARGTTRVTGAEELRAKEADRITHVVEGLRALGARITERPDGFEVMGVPHRLRGGRLSAHGDHRLAMLGAVAGLASQEGVDVEDAEAVAISFPGFYELLDSVTRR